MAPNGRGAGKAVEKRGPNAQRPGARGRFAGPTRRPAPRRAFLEKEGLSGHFFEVLPREKASAARFAPVYAEMNDAFLLYVD